MSVTKGELIQTNQQLLEVDFEMFDKQKINYVYYWGDKPESEAWAAAWDLADRHAESFGRTNWVETFQKSLN